MKRIIIAIALLSAPWLMPGTALADSGSYTTSSGETCSWTGFGSLYNVSCGGFNWRAGTYVQYTCDVTVFGSMTSWNCRSSNGATWSGSR